MSDFHISPLRRSTFEEVHACFQEAFAGYFVELPADPEFWRSRWKAARVRFEHSFGAYQGDRLVAFILHGVDHRQGQNQAYNAGTGVVPDHRGKGLIRELYRSALPYLREIGVQRTLLEVISQNEKAIRAYQKVGFSILRNLSGYQGTLTHLVLPTPEIHEVSFAEIDWDVLPNQDQYCWDHQPNSLQRSECRYFWVGKREHPTGFFALQPGTGLAPQMEILTGNPGDWPAVLGAFRSQFPFLRILNVDQRNQQKIAALEKAGLELFVEQFEMGREV